MPIALVLGGAACVWDDLRAARALIGSRHHIIVACNYAGRDYPDDIAALCTEHAELLAGWIADRRGNANYRKFVAGPHWTCRNAEVIAERWPGSSGLYAVQIGLTEMQCAAAILCGMPLDHQAGHFIRPGAWTDTAHFRHGFGLALPTIGARARSMGGWTAELLGSPTDAWLNAISDIRPMAGPTRKLARPPMHHVKNVSDETQRFHATDESGLPTKVSLAPGRSGHFEINPHQAAFQTGALKVTEPRPAEDAPAPKPRARKAVAKKPAAKPAKKAGQPA